MRKLALSLLAALTLSGCGYNEFQRLDEGVTAAWSEVVNNYQRKAVVTARASVGSLKVTPEVLNDPQAFSNFQKAQDGLSSALSRLLVVSENYPQLRATQQFSELAAQLEGAENRITVARGRYIKAVQAYNITVREFPNNLTAMVFGYKPKPNFTVENEKAISVAPKVDFGKPAEAKK